MKMIRLAHPDLEFSEVKNQLKRVIDSGWLTKGPQTEELEQGLCRYLGVKYAVAVSSGTAALHLSLLSLGIGPGDEVIVPDFTFAATANAVELCGAKAVLADIELDNFNIDPAEIRKRINSRTRAVIVVHQFGTPARMDEILKITKQHNLYLVEDAACALGARYKGKICGAIGDLGCFSFHPRKIITSGEGGMITTNSLRLAKRLRLFREHGMIQNGASRSFIALGFNYRISEVASVLALAQLKKIERIISQRSRLNNLFRRIISRLKVLAPVPDRIDKGSRKAHQAFVVKINSRVNIFALISFLRDKGIEATIANTALHIQPYYRKKYGFKTGQLKNSLFASRNSLALAFHCRMKEKDFIEIASALEEYFVTRKENKR
ncbi:DegT/DnrJ/EryC1/StrS family aminotransferase [Candidatus Omnitrophota bacterium]